MKKTVMFQALLTALIFTMMFLPIAGAEVNHYIMATGSVGGTFYPLGAAIAKVVSQYSPGVEISIRSTGATTENCRLLGTNKIEFALASGLITFAYEGTEMFSKPYKNLRAIGYIYADVVQWVVMADSDIYSLQDFRGKRVGVGPVGSGAESRAKMFLKLAGMTYKDITPLLLPFGQIADRMRDRQCDAGNFSLAVPAATVIDLATMHKIRIVEIKGELRERIKQRDRTVIDYTIPAGTYRGIDTNVETTGVGSGLFTREDMPDDDVYKVTKALFEHADEIAQIHPAGKTIKLKDAAKGIHIPFHEGALRYFKEKRLEIKQ